MTVKAMARAFAIGEESTAEPAEDADELVAVFWKETGVIAPMVEIKPPLTDRWGESRVECPKVQRG